MTIVKVQLKTHRQKKDNTYPVVIYVYENKPQYIYTGYSVLKEQFKEGQSNWIKKHPDAAVLNARIEDKRAEIARNIIPGVGYIEGVQANQNRANFCDYLRKRGGQYKRAHQIDMGLKCIRMADEIKDLKGRDIYASEINMDFIRDYVVYCKALPNAQNTIMRKVKNLRTLYNQAITEGVAQAPNPFNGYAIALDPVNKEKLTIEEIRAIEALQLDPSRTINHIRNAFLISFYCQGMRFESVCLIRWQDIRDGHLHYQMNKGKKWRAIELHPRLQALLDQYAGRQPYILPFFKEEIKDPIDLRNKKGSANAIANEHLKIIASLAEIDKPLTFHMARHTFAYLSKKKGISTEVIKDALGHTDTKITEVYLKSLDDDAINEAVRKVYE